MLYLSIALVICFTLYVIFRPEITINHTYLQKFPAAPEDGVEEIQSDKDIEQQGSDKNKPVKTLDEFVQKLNSIMIGDDDNVGGK